MKAASEGPLQDALKDIISGLRQKGRPTQEEIADAWREAAGKRGATHSRPVSLKKPTLVVNVDGSSWLYELTTKKKEILQKLGKSLKEAKIKDIRFRIGEVKDEKGKKDKA